MEEVISIALALGKTPQETASAFRTIDEWLIQRRVHRAVQHYMEFIRGFDISHDTIVTLSHFAYVNKQFRDHGYPDLSDRIRFRQEHGYVLTKNKEFMSRNSPSGIGRGMFIAYTRYSRFNKGDEHKIFYNWCDVMRWSLERFEDELLGIERKLWTPWSRNVHTAMMEVQNINDGILIAGAWNRNNPRYNGYKTAIKARIEAIFNNYRLNLDEEYARFTLPQQIETHPLVDPNTLTKHKRILDKSKKPQTLGSVNARRKRLEILKTLHEELEDARKAHAPAPVPALPPPPPPPPPPPQPRRATTPPYDPTAHLETNWMTFELRSPLDWRPANPDVLYYHNNAWGSDLFPSRW